jgi:hypothetical protein
MKVHATARFFRISVALVNSFENGVCAVPWILNFPVASRPAPRERLERRGR